MTTPATPEFVNETEAVQSVADPADISPHVAEPAQEAPEVEAPAADAAFDPDVADMFPRDYVEELRRENAKYRSRAREYEQAFDGYDDDTRAALLQYVALTRRAEAGDQEAQWELNAWLNDDEPDDEPDFAGMDAEQYLELVRTEARAEAQRIVAEREQYQSQEQAVGWVREQAAEYGFQYGTPDYRLFIDFAQQIDANDHPDVLAAAADQVRAYHRSIIEAQQDAYLAEKEAQNLAAPKVAGTGTSPNLAAGPPKTFAEARARFDERLQNQRG